MTAASPFTPDAVAAVTAHMNNDHADDSLLICRALGGQLAATSAQMTGLSEAGAEFTAIVGGRPEPVLIPWREPVTDRAQVRAEIVRMYAEACVALGVPPRDERHG